MTIGKFDGIHLGHKKLINNTVKYRKSGLSPVLFTFDISPLSFFGTNNKFIYTNTEKEVILSEYPVWIMLLNIRFQKRRHVWKLKIFLRI